MISLADWKTWSVDSPNQVILFDWFSIDQTLLVKREDTCSPPDNRLCVLRYHVFLISLSLASSVYCNSGDEVIEWNGRTLPGKTAQEVYDIVFEGRHDPQVELIVSRVIAANRQAAQASWRQSHSPVRTHQPGTTRWIISGGSYHWYNFFFVLSHKLSILLSFYFGVQNLARCLFRIVWDCVCDQDS